MQFAILTAPDALVVVALVSTASAATGAWYKASKNAKQWQPNGGKSSRDAIDRIEATVATMADQLRVQHADMLDVKADIRSAHDRLRSVEHFMAEPRPGHQ